jgi:predicted transcriptional regulator
LAAEIVHAQAGVAKISPDEIESLIKKIYDALKAVKEDEEGIIKPEETKPPVDPKKSIKQATITCLECGKTFKILSKRHLETHGLTPKEYREKWNFKPRQPLAAKSLSARRKQIAKEKNIGEALKLARMAKKMASEKEAAKSAKKETTKKTKKKTKPTKKRASKK